MKYLVGYLLVSTYVCGFLLLATKGESRGWKLFAIITMILTSCLGWVKLVEGR